MSNAPPVGSPQSFSLAGRAALVLGAGSSGVGWSNGQAISVAYARAGARVVAFDHVTKRAEETRDFILSEGGRCLALTGETTSSNDLRRAIERTVAEFGSLDVLHYNAAYAPFGDPVDGTEADWDKAFAINVRAVFIACKFALPIMIRQRRGVITGTSSILSRRVSEYPLCAYNSSKAALEQLIRTLAIQYAAGGIRANCVVPGLIDTPQIHGHRDIVGHEGGDAETTRKRDARSPTGKQGSAWDVAHASVFLASDAASYVNGHMLVVDGGLTGRQA
jgi:NAD(P)-dependent dehydrogenase (short-subunit alcohol dehydrogenase family)